MIRRKPDWLKIKIESGREIVNTENILKEYNLNSVCHEAKCPNRLECYGNRTATFMILGNICTRNCSYCGIEKGVPLSIDPMEPSRIAMAVDALDLDYVVITSVTRDDLKDSGAGHFADVVSEIKKRDNRYEVELLIPDFSGSSKALNIIINSKPEVINHNIESVQRLYPIVRPGALYKRSLDLLSSVKEKSSILTKSGLILGMGETESEIEVLLNDLRSAACDLLTLGQYCQPTKSNLKVSEFITPEKFDYWKNYALDLGFKGVASGPLVRSSYNAKKLAGRVYV